MVLASCHTRHCLLARRHTRHCLLRDAGMRCIALLESSEIAVGAWVGQYCVPNALQHAVHSDSIVVHSMLCTVTA
jgi:hypothetical protein